MDEETIYRCTTNAYHVRCKRMFQVVAQMLP